MKQENREQKLLEAARKDTDYQSLLAQCREAEQAYREIWAGLPPRQQEALERYIDLSAEMEYRLTRLALEIPEK